MRRPLELINTYFTLSCFDLGSGTTSPQFCRALTNDQSINHHCVVRADLIEVTTDWCRLVSLTSSSSQQHRMASPLTHGIVIGVLAVVSGQTVRPQLRIDTIHFSHKLLTNYYCRWVWHTQ